MTRRDPKAVVDSSVDGPPLFCEAIISARAQSPSAQDLARIAGKLPLGGGGPPGGGHPPSGHPAAVIKAAAAPSVLSGALVGGALGIVFSGALFVWQGHVEDQTRRTPAAVETPAASVAPIPPPVATAPNDPTAPNEAQATASSSMSPPSHAALATAKTDAVAPSTATAGDPIGPGGGDNETEAHVLQRAQAALGANPAQALALTDEHARRFPTGALGQEREVVAIQALLSLGRAGEARSRAARFLAAHPESAHRRRIESLLAP